MSINATAPAHAAEASSDEDSAPLSASPSSSSHASTGTSSQASTSATTSASSHTDATATPTADPTRDAILGTLLAELFGLKAEAPSTSHPAPTPCIDPAVWAACRGSLAAMSTMTTVQLLIAMRQGAPYTVERFIETFALIARAYKEKRDELRREDEAQGVSYPDSSEPGSQAATIHADSARTTNAAASSDATCSDATTLSAFFNLPHELQVRIVELSCRACKKALRCSSALGFDDATAIELLCTSRYFNALVTPFFYSHVRVSRPSSLLNLFNRILAHPERGPMVQSLHLGPDDELDPSHWPLSYDDDDLHMHSSLHSYFGSLIRETRINDCDLEPEWYSDVLKQQGKMLWSMED